MAMTFGEHFSFDHEQDKAAPDAHVVVLARCMGNILRWPGSPTSLVSAVIEDLGGLDAPLPGTVGADELLDAINRAGELKERHGSGPRPAGSGRARRRREPIRPAADDVDAIASSLDRFCACIPETPGAFGTIEHNMTHMQVLFALAADECALLALSMACGLSVNIDGFLDKCMARTKSLETVVAGCLGLSDERAREIVSSGGQLARSGVVRFDRGHRWFANAVAHEVSFRAALTGFHETADQLRTALVGSPVAPEFTLADFPHVQDQAALFARLLAKAKADKVAGVNLLFCGPVGVGKTTIAAAMAAAEGLSLYAVGESDEEGKEPERDQRLNALRIAQQVLQGQAGALCMVDEAADVLVPFRKGSIYVHRMLETNPCPTIYILNDVGQLSDAVKRRFTAVLNLQSPPIAVRETIVRRVLMDHGLAANDCEVRQIAGLGNVSPGIISNAAHAAALSGGGVDVVVERIGAVTRLLDDPPREPSPAPAQFDPRFCCADIDLVRLGERLVAAPRSDWSLLFLGPPGTGKSATARHIAERIGMPVLQIGGAQVLKPHVGETEMALAGYFAQARAERAFLIFDEVDSLIPNRSNSSRTWEVSLTNTLLELLQDHPLPVACATNARAAHDRLDPAILRRMTFKIDFGFLAPRVARGLFEHLFAMPAPAGLDRLGSLTPGDFAVVAKKAAILGLEGDADELCTMLAAECALKGEQRRDIGFHMPEPNRACKLAA